MLSKKFLVVVIILTLLLWVGGMWYIHSAFVHSGRYELDSSGQRKSWVETNGYKIVPFTMACGVFLALSLVIAQKIKRSAHETKKDTLS